MQFTDKDPLYRIVRITGPQHNLLGLEIAPAPIAGEPTLEALDRDAGKVVRLDGGQVAAQVMLGVDDACGELATRYHVEKIQYVAEDTPPVEVYRALARQLVLWIDKARRGERW